MALVYNGVEVNLVASKIPSGYVKVPVTTFTDGEYVTIQKTYSIAKSSVEDANAVTTFTALVAALDAAIQAELTADFDVTQTVTAFTSFTNVALDSCGSADSSSFYTNVAANYVCYVTTLVKTAV